MTVLLLGCVATLCVVGLAWILCAASARADQAARQQAEDAAYATWRAQHITTTAPREPYRIVVRGRE